ncbi:sensor domain-containing diguanylate cyclase [Chitinimonas koreensis]|uniref:sensor domain-containing diguanylate cyclase n=1 Tax=Chitinimonas koreensis TaxID=356302 RepID=UPI0012F9384F|nr:diguanylate cyclase [Chitinimonas koreensis]QNM96883.1 diguanylate cyclase [Chitinimonas koreensis]
MPQSSAPLARTAVTWRAFLRARSSVLASIVAMSIGVAGLIGWELRQSYRDTRSAAQLAAKNLSLLLKEQLDGAFRETDLVLRDLVGKVPPATVARLAELPEAERSRLGELLGEKLATLPQVETLALLSPDGRTALTPDRLAEADAGQQAFFRHLRENPGQALSFSPPFQLPHSTELGFVVARRIDGAGSQLGGAATALVKLEYFNQLARRLEAVDGSAFTLLDNDLVLVGRYPDLPGMVGKQVRDAAWLTDWVNGRSTGYAVFASPYDRVERGFYFHRLENFPFIVFVGVPEHAYFADWRLKAAAYVTAYLLLLVFSFGTAWRGWREQQLALQIQAGSQRRQEQDAHILRALDTLSRPLLLVRGDSGEILAANQSAGLLFGCSAAQLTGRPVDSLYLRGEHHAEIAAQLAQHKALSEYELKLKRCDGESFWASLSASLIEYQGETAYFVGFIDISERKAAQETLWRRATIDPLTGVANRGYFLERAQQEWQRALRYDHPLGLMLLDLDHFKSINDRYGHDAGDRVLRAFTDAIRQQLRETDLLGRLGGEEFAVLLPEENERGLLDAAERLRAVTAATAIKLPGGSVLSVTVSIGCTLSESTSPDVDSLLKEADLALYAAKRDGRDRVARYRPEMTTPLIPSPGETP